MFWVRELLTPQTVFRWEPREQTDQASAPQIAVFLGAGSDHGEEEEASPRVHDTTVVTRHREAEDGPSGELLSRPLESDPGEPYRHV